MDNQKVKRVPHKGGKKVKIQGHVSSKTYARIQVKGVSPSQKRSIKVQVTAYVQNPSRDEPVARSSSPA